MPRPTSRPSLHPPFYNVQALAQLRETFDHVCGGRTYNDSEIITLDEYYAFFNITDNSSDYAQGVKAKFQAHDVNGDGMVTFDEAQLRCGADGCD